MFWRFGGYANLSSLDTILDKPDVTLEEVLDENDVEAELKGQNAKLVEYVRDEVILGSLLRYVVAPKPTPSPTSPLGSSPESDKGRGGTFFKSRSKVRSKSRGADQDLEIREEKWRRYSYVSTQLLSSEVWSIGESLMENTDVLREFWDFIKLDAPLENVQAGYFTKVNESLLEKKPAEMIEFFKTLNGVVDNMIKHVDTPVIMDLLLKIISLEKDSSTAGVVDWLQSQDLVPKLLSYIVPEQLATVQTAAGDFLKAIITISANATGQDTTVIGPNELTRQLVSQTCVDQLLREMLKGGNPLTVGVGIIIEVIRKNNSDYDQATQIGPEPRSSDPIYLGNLLRTFAMHIPDFMELILSKEHTVLTQAGSKKIIRKDLSTAWGSKIEPLGFDRFKTCELMAELLHCSNMGLLNEKGSEGEVRKRDGERERLKAEGRLGSDHTTQESEDFAASVDSSGYHHAEAGTPLGGSPINLKDGEAAGALEEDFEKVNLSETDSTDDADLSSDPEDLGPSSPKTPKPSNKRRSSLLTAQLEAEKAKALKQLGGADLGDSDDNDKPAPLFSKRRAESSSSAGNEPSESSATESEAATEDEDESRAAEPESKQADFDPIPEIQREDDGSPVIGDLLKIMFVKHRVVPTIIDFFYRFPWNNFLHNVVYDVVQQVFNGAMNRGYNRQLAIDLFLAGRITDRIVEGQRASDAAQAEKRMRLGYMGHLTLIAEEVVKFTERQAPEALGQEVVDKISDEAWLSFVGETLLETRERDNAILGGVRPDSSIGPRQAVLNAVNAAQQGFGTGSNALANAGLTGGLDSMDLASAGVAGYGLSSSNSLLSGFGSSDDEEDDDVDDSELMSGDGAEEYNARAQSRRVVGDEDQLTNLSGSSSSADPPPIPAPLAVAPSRARLELARRLAEKQKRANASASASASASTEAQDPALPLARTYLPRRSSAVWGEGGDDNADSNQFPDTRTPTDESSAAHGGGFDDDFEGFGAAGQEAGHRDEDSEDSDDGLGMSLSRQTTREAVERRPLDEGDGSSEDEDGEAILSEYRAQTMASKSPSGTGPSSPGPVSPERGSPSATRAGALLSHSRTPSQDAEGKREQEAMLARTRTGAMDVEEDDDSSDDDEPVSMGSKYLARRRTGSR